MSLKSAFFREWRKIIPERKKYSENEYMFTSAKIAAMSAGLIGRDRLLSLTDETDAEAVTERLKEFGYGVSGDREISEDTGVETGASVDAEKLLTDKLSAVYGEITEFCPDKELLDLIRLRYDCHNVKTAVKCGYLGVDPAPYMIDCGSVPAATVAEAAKKKEKGCWDFLPENTFAAAEKASEELDVSGSARTVDALLDAACFADMLDYAARVGFAPAERMLKVRVDTTNIMSVLRIMRIKNPDTAASLREDSVYDGGYIPAKLLKKAGSPADLAELAGDAGYELLAETLKNAAPDGASLERASADADREFLRKLASETEFRMLGAYQLMDYVVSLEYEIKNLRIILSGKQSGMDPQTIRERLRLSDV